MNCFPSLFFHGGEIGFHCSYSHFLFESCGDPVNIFQNTLNGKRESKSESKNLTSRLCRAPIQSPASPGRALCGIFVWGFLEKGKNKCSFCGSVLSRLMLRAEGFLIQIFPGFLWGSFAKNLSGSVWRGWGFKLRLDVLLVNTLREASGSERRERSFSSSSLWVSLA